jgi:lipopolysaccharide biosynthesis regulator YciM
MLAPLASPQLLTRHATAGWNLQRRANDTSGTDNAKKLPPDYKSGREQCVPLGGIKKSAR